MQVELRPSLSSHVLGRDNSRRTRDSPAGRDPVPFPWAALWHPEHAATMQRVLAITAKRYQRNLVTYVLINAGTAQGTRRRPRAWHHWAGTVGRVG